MSRKAPCSILLVLLLGGCTAPKKKQEGQPAGKQQAAKGKAAKKKQAEEEIPPWDKKPPKFGEQTYRPSPGLYRIVVLHTNDIHGQVLPGPGGKGGLAAMAACIRRLREEAAKQGKGFLLLDAGDLFAGTPEGATSRGDVIVDYMNLVGYDALAVGDADYDQGIANLHRLAQRAQFPFLGANALDTRQGTHPEFIQPYVIKQVGPFRVGVIGLACEQTRELLPDSAWSGHDWTPARAALDRVLPQLERQAVDLVLVLSHLGPAADRQIAGYLTGVAAIVGGHAHLAPPEPRPKLDEQGVVTATAGQGTTLGWLELIVSLRTRKLLATKTRVIELDPQEYAPDKQIAALVEQTVQQARRQYDRPVATLGHAFVRRPGPEGSPLGNVLADALRRESGAEAALLSKRGLARDLPAGTVTLRLLYEAWPTNDRMVTMTLTGRQLTSLLEHALQSADSALELSGLELRYDAERPAGSRLLSLTREGKPIDPARGYRVATTERLAEGAEGHAVLRGGTSRKVSGLRVHDVFARYLASQSPLRVAFRQRIVRGKAGAPPEKLALAVLLARGGPEATLFNSTLRAALARAQMQGTLEARVEQPEFGGDPLEELRVRARRGLYKAILVVGREYGPALLQEAPRHPKVQFLWLSTAAAEGATAPANLTRFAVDLAGALQGAGAYVATRHPQARLALLAVAPEQEAVALFDAFRGGYASRSKAAGVTTAAVRPEQESATDQAGALPRARALLAGKPNVLLLVAGSSAKQIGELARAQQLMVVGLAGGQLQVRLLADDLLGAALAIGRAGRGGGLRRLLLEQGLELVRTQK